MDEIAELGDWEFLQSQEPNSNSNTNTINSNYFSRPSSDEQSEGGVDSDNPSSHGELTENPIPDFGENPVPDFVENPIPESGISAMESQNSNSSDEEIITRDEDSERKRGAWWEMPIEIVKFCVLKVKPVWCFSAIGVILGFVLIKRRMRKISEKKTRASVIVPTNEKRISKFAVRANNMNEDMRQVPIIRTSPSAGTYVSAISIV